MPFVLENTESNQVLAIEIAKKLVTPFLHVLKCGINENTKSLG